MGQPIQSYFESLKNIVRKTLSYVSFERVEYNPQRALWEIHGTLGVCSIFMKEVFIRKGRMYSYYVIREGEVAFGFDNYPDRQALQQKYGKEFTYHIDELIPHRHGQNKVSCELTGEMTVEKFLKYLCDEYL
ncbi:MAG: hypothetical protein AB7S75_02765 [Desulfococcaceae bacterium]